jgi:hypothetical protein
MVRYVASDTGQVPRYYGHLFTDYVIAALDMLAAELNGYVSRYKGRVFPICRIHKR